MRITGAIIIYLLCSQLLIAQTDQDSVSELSEFNPGKYYTTQFEKQSVTSSFLSRINYSYSPEDFLFIFRNNFSSTVTDLSQNSIKEEMTSDFLSSYKLSNTVSVGAGFKRLAQSDSRSIELNASSINRSRFFITAAPADAVDIFAFAGFAAHKQTDQYNSGYLYGSEIQLKPYSIENAKLSGSALYSNEDILPRRFLNRNIYFAAENSFAKGLRSIMSIRYNVSRRDFYLNAAPSVAQFYNVSKNIQNRNEEKTEFRGSIVSDSFVEHLSTAIDFTLASRTVSRDYRYKPPVITNSSGLNSQLEDFRVALNGKMKLDYSGISLLLRSGYSQHEEKNFFPDEPLVDAFTLLEFNQKEQEKNFVAERTSIGVSAQFMLSGHQELNIELSHNKYVYNTPSAANYDDRDELLSIARVEYRNYTVKEMLWSLGLEGYLSKNVYINAERSANNAVNRFIRYFADNFLTVGNITSKNHIEVSALYTVYDYEDLIPNFRSLSFRQFLFSDSTAIRIKGPVMFQTDLTLKLSEQGILQWDSFSTNPEREVAEFLIYPKFVYTIRGFSVFAGYRYLNIEVNRFENFEPVPIDTYTSHGPGGGVRYIGDESFGAEFEFHQENITAGAAGPRANSNIILTVQWYF